MPFNSNRFQMRFKDYLKEQELVHTKPGLKWDQLVKEIKERCDVFLDMNIAKPIFRAVSGRYLRAGYSPHPEGREPRDSGKEFNFTFNAGYQAAFGVPSIRTRTAFATGDASMTSEYGELAFFFPVGKFKFGWSPYFRDSYEREDDLEKHIGKHFKEICGDELNGRQPPGAMCTLLFDEILEHIKPHEWIRNLNDKGEDVTMMAAKMLDEEYGDYFKNVKSLHASLVEALNKTFTDLYVDGGPLEAAVFSKHEIFFYQTEGYYLVPYQMVTDEMDKLEMGTKNRDERYQFLMDAINSGHG